MKRMLLLLGAAALLYAGPAAAQYVFLDTNGDGICSSYDVLNATVTSIDIYFDTNHDMMGQTTTCPTGEPLSFFSYEFTLRSNGGGGGTISYGAYTNLMPTMTVDFGTASGGTDYHTGFGGSTILPPGRYKVGSLAVTIKGVPGLSIVASTTLSPDYLTAFGSQCPGRDFDGTLKLGSDFMSACATATLTDVKFTTWGAIKNKYR